MLSGVFWCAVTLTLAYEYLQFHEHYTDQTWVKGADVGLTLENVCMDAGKRSRYTDRVDCRAADLSAQESVWAAAFQSWWESRLVFRVATLDSVYVQVVVSILFLIIVWRLITNYHEERMMIARMDRDALPYRYDSSNPGVHRWLMQRWQRLRGGGGDRQLAAVHFPPPPPS